MSAVSYWLKFLLNWFSKFSLAQFSKIFSLPEFRSRYDKKPVQKSRPSTTTNSAAMTPMSLAAQSTSSSLPTTPQNKVTDKRLCRTEIKKRRAAQLAIGKC